jgi:Ca2+-binding RTX toxin-like protein
VITAVAGAHSIIATVTADYAATAATISKGDDNTTIDLQANAGIDIDMSGATSSTTGFTLTGNTGAEILTGSGQADIFTGAAGKDTISGGAGDDLINGSGGVDSMTGGTGKDDFVMSDQVTAAKAAENDIITDFKVAETDQIGNFSALDIENLASMSEMVYAGKMDEAIKAGKLTTKVAKVSAAYDLGTDAAVTTLALSSTTAFTAATAADAMETGGGLDLTMNVAVTKDKEGFLVFYDNNVDTFAGIVTFGANVADDAKPAAGSLTVTNIATLKGVSDASTIVTANTLDFLA